MTSRIMFGSEYFPFSQTIFFLNFLGKRTDQNKLKANITRSTTLLESINVQFLNVECTEITKTLTHNDALWLLSSYRIE